MMRVKNKSFRSNSSHLFIGYLALILALSFVVSTGVPRAMSAESCVTGDIDGNGSVEIADAIISLQVLAGWAPEATIQICADADNDGRVGMPEAVFVLRSVSGQVDGVISYPVIDTAQVSCYADTGAVISCPDAGQSSYGQDAQYPSNTADFINNGDGTVTDNVSSMTWQRHHSSAMVFADADTYCNELVLGGATDWRLPNIKELYSLIDFSGHTGIGEDTYDSWTPAHWKLYLDGSYDTSDDDAVFIQEYGNADTGGRILDCQIWSASDPVASTMNNDDSVLGGNFCDGRIKAYPKAMGKFTKCVRGNTDYTVNDFAVTDNGDTVTDNATGLVWTRVYSNETSEFPQITAIGNGDGSMEWADALGFCEELDYAGYTDWKLPDVKELQSIVAYGQEEPVIDTSYFSLDAVELPDYCNGGTFTSYPYFWSSTSHVEYSPPDSALSGSKASYVAFGKAWGSMNGGATWIDAHGPGAQRSDPKTGDPGSALWACGFGPQGDYIGIDNYVRCVRADRTSGSDVASFSASSTAINEGDSVIFADGSSGSPVSWSWTFAGGTPAVSTSQNPVVVYNSGGSYGVTLTTTYADGSDSANITDYITVTATSGVLGGYMLLAPLQSLSTYLVDTDESIVKTWTSSYRPGNAAYLLEDGVLLRTGKVSNGNRFADTGGAGGIVEKTGWDNTVSWSYQLADDNECLHHDVEMLPNGNILMISWEYKTSTEAETAGRNPDLLADGQLWPDKIIEVDPATDTVVWEWHVWDHLIQDYSSSKSNYGVVADHPELIDLNYVGLPSGVADWNHVNAVDYNPELDQIILSSHACDEFWVIDHSTTTAEAASHSGGTHGKGGDLLYRWGNPAAYGSSGTHEFYGQHDAQWIATGSPGAGNILVFNNGQGRPAGNYSTIDEIVPDMNGDGSYPVTAGQAFGPSSQEWTYQAAIPTDFYGMNISGAQRLANGNTLICNGPSGYLFEVTYDGTIVWTYQNTDGTAVFRAYKYPYDYSGLSQL